MKKYNIIAFETLNKTSTFAIEKDNLTTAFYCFRDCINSGLYCLVTFRVNETYKCGATSSLIMQYDGEKVKSTTSDYNYYMARFKGYLKRYGTTKEIKFDLTENATKKPKPLYYVPNGYGNQHGCDIITLNRTEYEKRNGKITTTCFSDANGTYFTSYASACYYVND